MDFTFALKIVILNHILYLRTGIFAETTNYLLI